ncbi:MAG: vWA domain-containing protein [Bacillota bacterium]
MINYLEDHVARFAQVLRRFGLPVGTSEVLDALEALKYIELTDKNHFRTALKATLLKDPVNNAVFENAFNAYFVAPDVRKGQVQDHQDHLADREEAKKELEFQDTALDLDERYLDMYLQLPDKEQKRVKDFITRTSQGKNVTSSFKPILEKVIKGALNYQKERRKELRLVPVQPVGDEEIDAVLHQITVKNKEKDLLYRNMEYIDESEYQEARVLIRKLTRRLASGISRRYQHSSKIRRVDLRRSIRAGIRYGGTLIDLKYKQKKIQKPEIIFLCDISGSMLKYSQFTLLFMQALSESLPRINAFVFADSLEKVDFRRFSMEQLTHSQIWGEGTNIHAALKSLMENYYQVFRRASVLIVLSDTKSPQGDQAAERLKTIKRKVKEIVWLNPLPKADWSRYPTVSLFQKYCSMRECSSLAQLAKVLTKHFV